MSELKQKLEVLLFMSRNSLSLEDIAKYLDNEQAEVESALQELTADFQNGKHGIQIIQVAGGYQFATKPQYTKTLELYINAPQEVSLSTAAMETLVIIAYRQPVSRTEVETIRGVNSDGIIKSLYDKGLIEEKGKSEAIGRPTLYGTTDNFLKHFGLKDLSELPTEPITKMQKLNASEQLQRFSKTAHEQLDLTKAEAELKVEEKTVIEPYELAEN